MGPISGEACVPAVEAMIFFLDACIFIFQPFGHVERHVNQWCHPESTLRTGDLVENNL